MAAARYAEFLEAENALVAHVMGCGASQRWTLRLLGIAASSWHYRHHPRTGVSDPLPQARRAYRSRLSPEETDRVRALLKQGFTAGDSVYQCWFNALDNGDPIASLSSWYRIAATSRLERPARPRRRRRTTAMPEFEATAANQVWCWDITKLPGTYHGQWLAMYVVLDAFSRYVIAYRVEEAEDDELAKDMFEQAITTQGGAIPAIVHSDGGSSMMSNTLAGLYRDLGIIRSKNRPRVSNDNPFIESWFKTAKYRPKVPAWFNSLDHARTWAADTIEPPEVPCRIFLSWKDACHAEEDRSEGEGTLRADGVGPSVGVPDADLGRGGGGQT